MCSSSNDMYKAMATYFAFTLAGFLLLLIFLDRIQQQRDESEKPCIQASVSLELYLLDNVTI